MTTPPDRPSGTETLSQAETLAEAEAREKVPDWAIPDLFPPAEAFVAAFSGAVPATAADIMGPAYDLVECMRDYQLACGVLADQGTSPAELRAAGTTLTTAESDIAMLTDLIDDAVPARIVQRRKASSAAVGGGSGVGGSDSGRPHAHRMAREIAATMARLRERDNATAPDPLTAPTHNAHDLDSLRTSYDYLAADIESGHRLLPGM
ncbi:hypothetical protein [Nocardia wallacei]|uniref:hypothetical protein n=1 Tax=Nocardia wallacei TaxID=480035 RepID=UPI00245871B7|nr:hypothetical protein [Nocardia wallacei]